MENWLTKRARLSPKQTALVYQGQKYTFQEVAQKARQLAKRLVSLGITQDSPVAILGFNSRTTYFNLLALQQLGARLIFLNPRLDQTTLQTQVQQSQAKWCLVDRPELASLVSTSSQLTLVTSAMLAQLPVQAYTPADVQLEAVASLMYTSGSTGKPKGVLQTYGNHWASAMNTLLNFQVTQADAWLCVVPLFHISGFSILLRSLIYGIPIYLEKQFDPQRCHKLLVQEAITIMSVVPTMLKELLRVNPQKQTYNSQFRLMFLGGGPLDAGTLKQCQQQGIPTIQSYGMTETCSNVVALKPQDAARKLGSSGQALFSNQIRIAQANVQGQGEIQVQSPALTPGYWQQPELFVRQLTADGWFKTGDVGYLDPEGFLYVQGRLDEMFISGGENIFPNQIENVYQTYPGIQEIAVTDQTDSKWGAVPIAYYVGEATLTDIQLREFGRQHLAHYQVPVEFRHVQHLPHTASGKLQKSHLKELAFQVLSH
ncbi:o-succinylbenzoate--CoA ligase [Lactobacillus sp. DCY120]|uniref:2-succinylbenzoate--CoA ligase n=1 Tax=Bombilactobacillus apium TaxID=2675299 RepID=A0A850R796_9LACO|nr:o-succinylbenzoate--CoA ligase [Bombilactobacillus apium]NVY96405.1 o-succinylbenzoate--CoA ligase [Bombilactobacillus apium]